jgi:RHS repeat-associated protein
VNDQGQIEWAAAIDAWGNVKGEHNPKGMYQPIRLPGQHRDLVSDLSYNRHRYYESTKGYYLNQDPIGLSGGRNFYEYPINPINHIDPLGLKKFASNHPHCQGIRDKIAGLRKELDKRWGDIKANPQNMPIRRFPLDPQKGPLEQDVRGHMVIINDRDTKLRQWEKQYDKDCESDDDNNNGPGLGACVAVALIAVGLILAPEITLPVLVLAKATQ